MTVAPHPTLVSPGNSKTASLAFSFHSHLTAGDPWCFHPHSLPTRFHSFLACGAHALHSTKRWCELRVLYGFMCIALFHHYYSYYSTELHISQDGEEEATMRWSVVSAFLGCAVPSSMGSKEPLEGCCVFKICVCTSSPTCCRNHTPPG